MRRDTDGFADEIDSGLMADTFLACFKTLDGFTEEEARWIIPGWMPEEQITLLAADGGTGKTSVWTNILSALSSGGRCILDPPDYERKPMTVAFLTTEDSVSKKLKRKLREAGADMQRIITMDISAAHNGELRDFKFGTQMMAEFVRHFRPAVCVFDPVQGFIPPEVNMGSRNAMRDCTAPLIALGEEVGTTFLLVCHTNKRKGASGRDRIADSADLWDVSRSVWMAGYTDDYNIRYLSNEKNNYAKLQETQLFTIDEDGQVLHAGTSWKRDREYMQDYVASVSKRGDCKEWLDQRLDAATAPIRLRDLYDDAEAAGYSQRTVQRAVNEVCQDKRYRRWNAGNGKDKAWWIEKASTV